MICAIIAAAGQSVRMGTRKLLLPVGGKTMIERVVDAFSEAAVDQIVVVVRAGEEMVRAALIGRAVTFVDNDDPQGDMLSSVRGGLRALPPEASTILVSPGDQPGLRAETVARMLRVFKEGRGGVMVPVYQGKRGHPLIFSPDLRPEILECFDGTGLRGLLAAHAAEVCEWPCTDPAVVQDIDTPEDYRAAIAQQEPQPTRRGRARQ